MEQKQLSKDHYWTKPETQDSELNIDETLTFRQVFLYTNEGKQVLKWLLLNLGLYKPVTGVESAVLQNFAIKLLCTLDVAKQEQLESMIDYYTDIASKDALHPRKRNYIRSKLHVGTNES